MAGGDGRAANTAINELTSELRDNAKEIIGNIPNASDKEVRARIARMRYETTQTRDKGFRAKIQAITPEQSADNKANVLAMTDTRGSTDQRMKRHFIENAFIDFLIKHEKISQVNSPFPPRRLQITMASIDEVFEYCPTAAQFISYA